MSAMHVNSTSCYFYGSSTDGSRGLATPISTLIACPPTCVNREMEIRRVTNYHHGQTTDTYLEANYKTISKCGVGGAAI